MATTFPLLQPGSIMTANVLQPVELTAQSAARMLRALTDRVSRQRAMRALSQLDDHVLSDVGLTRMAVGAGARGRGSVVRAIGPGGTALEWE